MSGTYLQNRTLYPDWGYYTSADRYGTTKLNARLESTNYQFPTSVNYVPGQSTFSYRSRGDLGDLVSKEDGTQYVPFATRLKAPGNPDLGHDFWTCNFRWITSDKRLFFRDLTTTAFYKGPFWLSTSQPAKINIPVVNDEVWGSKAIAATKPTKTQANLAQTISELLRDGAPAMVGFAAINAQTRTTGRSAGGEFLNVQFGMMPLYSDIKSLCEAVVHSNTLLEQYSKNAGRPVRRTKSFPNDYQTTVTSLGARTTALGNSQLKLETGDAVRTVATTQEVWFAGAYLYYLAEDDSFVSQLGEWAEKANYLLGVRMTPDVLWELAPWSWLVDWYLNIGEFISNSVSIGLDGLVLKYGYLMNRTIINTTEEWRGVRVRATNGSFLPLKPRTHSFTGQVILKRRVHANPYGFGLKGQPTTAGQWAILGALGLTKAPGKMWN